MNQCLDKILVFFLRGFTGFVTYAPWFLLNWIAILVSRVRSVLPGRELSWMHDNLKQIYGLPSHSFFAKKFRHQVFYHQVISVLETIRCIHRPHLARWEGLTEFQKNVQRYEAAGAVGDGEIPARRGQVLITGHVGCWELVGWWAAQFSQQSFYALAKPARSKVLTEGLEALRKKMGIHVLWTGQKTIQRQMLKALAKGGWLGFVMDQKPAGRIGPRVRFMGHPTEFVAGPAKMATRSGLPVLGVFCLRLAPMRYRLVCHEVAPGGHEITDSDEMTQMMADELSRVIRAYPEQWCWNYKRWIFNKVSSD